HAVPDAGGLPPGAKALSVTSADGHVLKGVHVPPEKGKSSRILILGFGGNAWNGQDVAEYLHELFPAEDVIVFHYRGYPPSSGAPSAQALIADAPIVHDAAVELVRPDQVIAVGFSIGTGVAATLAGKRELDGLILVTPFDSLRAVAASMYPWLPIGPFFNHEIDALAPLRDAPVRVAVIAAEDDEIIPAERTDALREALPNLVFDRTIKDAGHNDIYARSDFQDAMHEALGAILKTRSS
ncbi:MAG TPA: alpha/beta fold hydrolase, partial [Sphingomicrobium sp.]|nr:alpha/beta fold hydrolase [Sphingomicrobium sp.]